MALNAGKRAGEGEATGAAVFVGVDVASKVVSSATSVFCKVGSCTDHIVHKSLRSGSVMMALCSTFSIEL